jgi:sugar lactone lactonase YvrE
MSLLLAAVAANAQYNINTIAGNGTSGFSGDGGPATNAMLSAPYGVAVDASGNVYIPDGNNNRLRMVSPTGTITTIAGTGTAGYTGDGSAATNAELKNPTGVALDASGNIYIADGGNNVIRKINGSGIITTIAGTGTAGFSGDGGLATNATLDFPCCVAIDKNGNVLIADLLNQRIRKIDHTSTNINTIAGNGTSGFSGDGAAATNAELANPFGVAVDNSGNVYIADQFNDRVRMVTNTTKFISTIAGNGTASYSGDNGPATAAELDRPFSLSLDGFGDIYVADYSNNRIRRIDIGDSIFTVAGTGVAGFSGDGGPALSADLKGPSGITIDPLGNLYISDQSNDRIRELTNITAGINELKINNEQLKIYPNPSNGLFNLSIRNLELGMKYTIDVYSVLGEKTYSSGLLIPNLSTGQVDSQFVIDMTGSPAGIYMYRVISANGVLVGEGKLIKE